MRRHVDQLRLSKTIAEDVKEIRREAMSRVERVTRNLRSLANRHCPACEKTFIDCQVLCQKCTGEVASAVLSLGHIVGQTLERGIAANNKKKKIKLEQRLTQPLEINNVKKQPPPKKKSHVFE